MSCSKRNEKARPMTLADLSMSCCAGCRRSMPAGDDALHRLRHLHLLQRLFDTAGAVFDRDGVRVTQRVCQLFGEEGAAAAVSQHELCDLSGRLPTPRRSPMSANVSSGASASSSNRVAVDDAAIERSASGRLLRGRSAITSRSGLSSAAMRWASSQEAESSQWPSSRMSITRSAAMAFCSTCRSNRCGLRHGCGR